MINDESPNADPGSFRDPSGTVFSCEGKVFRQVNPCYREQYDSLIASGLYNKLVRQKLLVAHNEVDRTGIDEHAYLVLEPELIPLISYPYEWCFGQLKDAALTTLRIHRLAMEHGMILKDASAYNIQFLRGKAMHIDTLSFDFYKEGEPWVAYGQFCRHFLAPLFLMVYTDVRLSQLMRVYIDGVPLDLASKLLGGKGGFAAKAHIKWHARSIQRHSGAGAAKQVSERASVQSPEQASKRRFTVSKFKMTAMIDSLISIVEKLELRNVITEWGDYYNRTNYTESASGSKKSIVSGFLNKVSPKITWDFGANDGTYSAFALQNDDSFVAAFDIDPVAVERNYSEVKRTGRNMLPLLLDLTNPSPSIGFACRERGSLESRQRPDCILMLAVIHHLAISNNLPLGNVAKWLASICDNLIIEFVPKSDSQVQVLLATRDDIFPEYTMEGFERAFGDYFAVVESSAVESSERVVYLMRRRLFPY
jgi:hypothetical protein